MHAIGVYVLYIHCTCTMYTFVVNSRLAYDCVLGRKGGGDGELDPMDPASYSDIPR